MAKLVLLSAGLTGRTHELKVEKTTIGRVEDNTFPITEASVSSHHCEIILKGEDFVVKDLGSTNGTFIAGEKITESVLKPGQILRLGQIEMRLETEATPAPSAKRLDQTMVMQRGVQLSELEAGGGKPAFDKSGSGFSKKDNKVNKIFLFAGIGMGLVIVGLLLYVFLIASK
ncbi:MAG: FHA domain-containing protein [Verrucomicrobiota bacterium]